MENNVAVSFDFIKQLKKQIVSSRYIVAKIANAESLKLYFTIGSLLEQKFSTEKWGTKILDNISTQLQQELPGLRGFSAKNLSKMRAFYNAWCKNETIYSLTTSKLDNAKNSNDSR